MPSSLTRAHPPTWVHSHPPTCVGLRYGRRRLPRRGFSRRGGLARSALVARSLPHASGANPLRAWPPQLHRDGGPTPPRPRGGTSSAASGNGISTVCPSPTPCGLGLGPTNPTRKDLPSEPWGFRWAGFAPAWRYSCRHSHSGAPPAGLPTRLRRAPDAPLPLRCQHRSPQLRHAA